MGIISSADLLASDSDDASSTSGHHSHAHHRHHHKHHTASPANRSSDGRDKGKVRPKSLTSLIVDKTCILKKHSPEDDDDLTGHNNNGDNNKPAATGASGAPPPPAPLQSIGSSVDPHSKDNCPLAAAASSEATRATSSHGQTVRWVATSLSLLLLLLFLIQFLGPATIQTDKSRQLLFFFLSLLSLSKLVDGLFFSLTWLLLLSLPSCLCDCSSYPWASSIHLMIGKAH